VPKPFFLSESYEPLRKLLLDSGQVIYGPCGQCFPDAGVEACIGLVKKQGPPHLCVVDGRDGHSFADLATVPEPTVSRMPFRVFTYMLPEQAFSVLYSEGHSGGLTALREVVTWTRGVEAGKSDSSVYDLRRPGAKPLIVGEAVTAFDAPATAWIMVDRHDETKFKPSALYSQRPKLLVRRVALTLVAAVDESGAHTLNTLYVGQLYGDADPYALAALGGVPFFL